MKRRRDDTYRQNRGYALLVTLVMLALLGVILGGMARRSADSALQARDAEQSMRQRWAELSCSHTFLNTAVSRADDRDTRWQNALNDDAGSASLGFPRQSEVFVLKLVGLDLWGRIDDEQAKINLNERLRVSPNSTIMPSRVIDQALSPSRSQKVLLTGEPFVQSLGLQPLMSWAQVMPGSTPAELLEIDRPEGLANLHTSDAVVDRATLWGDGRLNLWNADEQVIRKRLQSSVQPGTTEALLRLRQEVPTLPLGTLYENATGDRDERAVLAQVFTQRSACFSMWLATRPAGQENAEAQWSLRVIEQDGSREQGRVKEFRW